MLGSMVGKYRITAQLGQGGMGIVYAALNDDLNKRAVIKMVKPDLSANAEIAARFSNEAKAAASIHHPGIVDVYEIDKHENGCLYIVMEYLDGETLGSRLQRARSLPEEIAVPLTLQAVRALGAAHNNGIIHRDLKPDNIFLVPDHDISVGERVKLLDFGTAKLLQQDGALTCSGMLMGTPPYMSPEQCRGAANVDLRSDLYSMGVILFEMLAGRRPFVGRGHADYLQAHLTLRPPSVTEFNPGISPALSSVVDRLLAKDPGGRFNSADDLLMALDNACGSGPALRKPATPAYGQPHAHLHGNPHAQHRANQGAPVQSRSASVAWPGRAPAEAPGRLLEPVARFDDEIDDAAATRLMSEFRERSRPGAAQPEILHSAPHEYERPLTPTRMLETDTPKRNASNAGQWSTSATVPESPRVNHLPDHPSNHAPNRPPSGAQPSSNRRRRRSSAMPFSGQGHPPGPSQSQPVAPRRRANKTSSSPFAPPGGRLQAAPQPRRRARSSSAPFQPHRQMASDFGGAVPPTEVEHDVLGPGERRRSMAGAIEPPRSTPGAPIPADLRERSAVQAPAPGLRERSAPQAPAPGPAPSAPVASMAPPVAAMGPAPAQGNPGPGGPVAAPPTSGPSAAQPYNIQPAKTSSSSPRPATQRPGKAAEPAGKKSGAEEKATRRKRTTAGPQFHGVPDPSGEPARSGGSWKIGLVLLLLAGVVAAGWFVVWPMVSEPSLQGDGPAEQAGDAADDTAPSATGPAGTEGSGGSDIQTPPNPASVSLGVVHTALGDRAAMRFVGLPGGEFTMGSPVYETGRVSDEREHRVRVSAFALAEHEVTQAQWQAVMGENPSDCTAGCGDDLPVQNISWIEAVTFLERLSVAENLDSCYDVAGDRVTWKRSCTGYRLPTEAEWEFACRAETRTAYSFGDSEDDLAAYAWFSKNAESKVHPVGTLRPNPWGLHDMHGNVREWVWDWQAAYLGEDGEVLVDPAGADKSTKARLLRGGSFSGGPWFLRCAGRHPLSPGFHDRGNGLRIARTMPP